MTTLYLTEVRRRADVGAFRMTWNDGHSADLPYDLVRGYCPCASCQGHNVAKVTFHQPPKPVTPTTVEPVGNYAISIFWSDGHATGIYRFDFLRQICPCPQCSAARPDDGRTR